MYRLSSLDSWAVLIYPAKLRKATMKIRPDEVKTFLEGRSRSELDRPELHRAGVLLLLFDRDGETRVLLTKRTSDVEHHKGQISLPGGSMDPGDADVTATALREAEEEVGLRPSTVQVLGLFDDVWTPSGFRITPVVGHAPDLPEVRINTREVEEIIDVPVSLFLDPANERVKHLMRDGKQVKVYFYTYGSREIWGATAGILRSFLRMLTKHRPSERT
jgi:8-oxo-dGTP pyrophosphatase MutT (NUDIX family)